MPTKPELTQEFQQAFEKQPSVMSEFRYCDLGDSLENAAFQRQFHAKNFTN